MSIPNASPSSSSSEALWSLKHDLPEEGQLLVAGENATEAPAPTNSTGFIKTPKQQFSADDKNALEHTAVGPPEQSTNQLSDVNGNGDDERINNVGSSSTTRGLTEEKRVKQLRLLEALTVPETTTIYEARCLMAANRADVLVVTDSNGLLTGILTNKDITRRVIAPGVDMLTTSVSKVMTRNPIFVLSDTLVVEAVQKMMQDVEKVTQLPVIEDGKVIGLVCLPLCLFDDEMANTETTTDTYDDLTEATVQRVAQRGITVKELPEDIYTILPDTTTIYEVWCNMAAKKLDAVILTGLNALFSGILTIKDIVTRVIPCGIDVVNTPVSKVMRKTPIFVCCAGLPIEAQQKIVQGEVTQLLVVSEIIGFDSYSLYQPLSLHRGAENHKVIDSPKRTSSKRVSGVNALDGTHGPGLTRFVHVTTKSPYPNAIPPVGDPTEQSSHPLPSANAWDGTHGPDFSGFVHANNSPYPNDVDNLVAPPPHHTAVRPPSNRDSQAPGFSPLVRVNNSPYANDDDNLVAPPPHHTAVRPLSNRDSQAPGFSPLVRVNNSPSDNSLANGDDQTINKSTTNFRSRGLRKVTRVKQLQLSEALTVPETTSIYDACCQMAAERADVLVLTHSTGGLTGIVTDKDILTRVIACEIDLVNTPVSEVMTKNPTFLLSDEYAEDARVKAKGFAQFPVIEDEMVIGLYIPNDADAARNITLGRRPYPSLARHFNTGLTVKQLPLKHALIVPETTTIYETCWQMAAGRVEAVVLTDSNALMMGTLTKTDIVSSIIPRGIDFVNTPVSKVMTESTIFVPSDTFSMEISQEIVRGLYLKLLVIEKGEDNDLVYLPLRKYSENDV